MPSLEFTTAIGCPLMCKLCPQENLKNAYTDENKYLSYESFVIMLNKIPKHVRIDFSGMSEPWINHRCTEMFEYALQQKFEVAVYTTLVGIDKKQVNKFINLITLYQTQIKILCVHLPDKSKNMRNWKYTDDYESVLSSVLNLDENIKEKINFNMMTMDNNNEVDDSLLKFNVYKYFKNNWYGHTRAGSLNVNNTNVSFITDRNIKHETPVSCASSLFYDHNVVLPNGDVLLCCMDYNMKHKIGNLLKNSYEDLYLSPTMINIMKENKKNEFSKCSICKSCYNVISYKIEKNHWVKK